MERNAHKQLNIKITKHTAVISSIKVVAENLKNFNDVITRKQNPKKLDDAFKICGDFLSSMQRYLMVSVFISFTFINCLNFGWYTSVSTYDNETFLFLRLAAFFIQLSEPGTYS